MRVAVVVAVASGAIACASVVGIREVRIVDDDDGGAAAGSASSSSGSNAGSCASAKPFFACKSSRETGELGHICIRSCECADGLECLRQTDAGVSGLCANPQRCGATCAVDFDCASLACTAGICD